jgi:hypothetical protein
VRKEKSKTVPTLELALVGTLFIADAVCVRLWLIMEDIRLALNDPGAMAIIITDNSIKSDSSRVENQLNTARSAFEDTERATAVFSVCLALITLALLARMMKARR